MFQVTLRLIIVLVWICSRRRELGFPSGKLVVTNALVLRTNRFCRNEGVITATLKRHFFKHIRSNKDRIKRTNSFPLPSSTLGGLLLLDLFGVRSILVRLCRRPSEDVIGLRVWTHGSAFRPTTANCSASYTQAQNCTQHDYCSASLTSFSSNRPDPPHGRRSYSICEKETPWTFGVLATTKSKKSWDDDENISF